LIDHPNNIWRGEQEQKVTILKNKLVRSNPDLIKFLSPHLPAGNPPNKIASIESVTSTIQVQSVAARPPSGVVILLKVIAMD
jgi:hypothetical protein